jgi:hypothetical protein
VPPPVTTAPPPSNTAALLAVSSAAMSMSMGLSNDQSTAMLLNLNTN